jgi:hypothetical protein
MVAKVVISIGKLTVEKNDCKSSGAFCTSASLKPGMRATREL